MKKRILAMLAVLVAAPALAGQETAVPAQPAAPTPQATPTPKPATLGLFVYPANGQDAARQGQDEDECYGWARQQTGVDPTAAPTPAAAAEAPKGGAVKGAAGGAAAGAAIGAIAGDAGEGAAIGAVAGAAKGRRAQKKAKKQAQAQAQQAAQAQDTQVKDTFKKAWGACLEGRGYSVK
jgi:hypothetical protein